MPRRTWVVSWAIAAVAFAAWVLAVVGVYWPGRWIHVLLVIAAAFAITALFMGPGSARPEP